MPRPRPRRRQHRLEWTDSMQSAVTLVAVTEPLPSTSTQTPTAPAASAAAPQTAMSAELRPSQIRNSAATAGATRSSALSGGAVIAETAAVARSNSEQTTSSANETSALEPAKSPLGFGRRLKNSLRMPFKYINDNILHARFHESSQGIDGYYSVSLH